MLEMEKFSEPKPPTFAFRIDVRPEKRFGIESSFKKHLQDNVTKVESQIIGQNTQSRSDFEELNPTQKKAEAQTTHELSTILGGLKTLSKETKLGIELTANKFNFERIKESDYLSKSDIKSKLSQERLGLGVASLIDDDDDDDELDIEDVDGVTEDSEVKLGKEHTTLHNVNLYGALASRNPIKKQSIDYQVFNEDPLYNTLDQNFISPLYGLQHVDSNAWNDVKSTMTDIQDRNQAFKLQDLADPYYGNDVESFTMYMDYFDFFATPSIYQRANADEITHVIWNLAEDLERFDQTFRGIYGAGNQGNMNLFASAIAASQASTAAIGTELDAVEEVITQLENQLIADDDPTISVFDQSSIAENSNDIPSTNKDELTEEELAVLSDESLKQLDEWMEKVGLQIKNESKLLTASLIPEIATLLSNQTNWGDLTHLNVSEELRASVIPPKEHMVTNYFKHIKEKYIPQYLPNRTVSQQDFLFDNRELTAQVWDALRSKGLISQDGQVSSQFDLFADSLDIAVPLGDDQEQKVLKAIREAKLGKFSFEANDVSKVNGQIRRNQRLFDEASGTYMELPDIINMIGKGKDVDSKLFNTKEGYHKLLQVYSNVTNLTKEGGGNGKVAYTPTDDGVEVVIDDNGTWQEWTEEHHQVYGENGEPVWVAGWKTVTDQPLKITFANAELAQKFADDLLGVIQLNAPVLRVFSQDDLYMLTNNAMSLDHSEIVTKDHEDYRMSINKVNRYDSAEYTETHQQFRNKAALEIGRKMFEKNQVNKIILKRHKDQHKQYDKKKEEHELKELERIRAEAKVLAKRRQELKEQLKRIEQLRKREAAALKRRSERDNKRANKKK